MSTASYSAKTIRYLETTAEKGEGIYQLLRRFGLKANKSAYNAFVNINASQLQKGTGLLPRVTYTLPIISVSFDEPFDSVLRKLGVHRHRTEIFNYNKKYNTEFTAESIDKVPSGEPLLIPELGSGFYKASTAIPEIPPVEVTVETPHELSIPYPKIKNKIKSGSISTKLKNYCFVLDSGHGGKDPGTNPVVERGDGKEAQTYEAPLVYDTTLRLLKQIRMNGGEVFLTHYSTRYGIRNIKNPQDYRDHEYNLSSRDIRKDSSVQTLRERKVIVNEIKKRNYNKRKKIIFLSIHADYVPNKTRDLPIIIFYSRHTGIDRGRSKQFAQKLSRSITGTTKNSKSKGLGVLYKNAADLEVLIELANLNNKNGAWRLRDHSYRERLARTICDGLIKSLPK